MAPSKQAGADAVEGDESPAAASIGLCSEFRQHVAPEDQGILGNARSKQLAHRRCVAADKGRKRQNSKNRSMAQAWEAMSPDESVAWYMKNASAELDERLADPVVHSTVQETVASRDVQQINHAEPFSQ